MLAGGDKRNAIPRECSALLAVRVGMELVECSRGVNVLWQSWADILGGKGHMAHQAARAHTELFTARPPCAVLSFARRCLRGRCRACKRQRRSGWHPTSRSLG